MGKRVMEVPWKRRRERPKRRWMDNIRNYSLERDLSEEETQDRVQWRRLIRNIGQTATHKSGIRMQKKKKYWLIPGHALFRQTTLRRPHHPPQ